MPAPGAGGTALSAVTPAGSAGGTGFLRKKVGASAISIMSARAQMTRRSMTQVTGSGNGIDATRIERATTGEAPRGEPRALEGTVAPERFEGVLGAGGSKPAARRKRRRDGHLISADQQHQRAARDFLQARHRSPHERGIAPGHELTPELGKRGVISLPPGPDDEIGWGLDRPDLAAPDFPEPPPQTIAGHRGRPELRNDQSHARMARWIVGPDHIEMLDPPAPASSEAVADVRGPREPVGPREALRWRQKLPCFDGSETTSRFRPFFRRRDNTARPQRSAMRARNPCFAIRRLLRGRYDGFIGLLQ